MGRIFVGIIISFLLGALLSIAVYYDQHHQRYHEQLHTEKRRLEVAHSNKFPDKFTVRALINLADDITKVTGRSPSDLTFPNAISWKSGWDFKYWVESKDGTEAAIVRSTDWSAVKKTVIFFRGTNEIQDWWTNLDYGMEVNRFVNAPGSVEVHGGFQDSLFESQPIATLSEELTEEVKWSSILSLLEEKVMDLIGDTNELYLSGHSLG